MDMSEKLKGLQEYARYRAARKLLRRNAYGSLFFGLLATVGGATGLQHSLLNVVLLCIGLVLLVAGLWSLLAPGALALLLEGLAFVLVGCWNVSFLVLAFLVGAEIGPNLMWGALGIFQIVWGIQILGPKSRMAAVRLAEPPSDVMREIDSLAKTLKRSKEKEDEQNIEFCTESFSGILYFRGRLLDDAAFLVDSRGTHMYFLSPAELDVRPKSEKVKKKGNKATIRIRDDEFKGRISELSAGRIALWKERHPAAAQEPGDPQNGLEEMS